jgi:DnaJ homolog subfamily C member 7
MDSGTRYSSGTQASESSSDKAAPTSPVRPKTPPDTGGDPILQAERIKEQGNAAFKAKRYEEAVDLYTKAVGADYILLSTLNALE